MHQIFLAWLTSVCALVFLSFGPLGAQQLSGLVAEQGTLAPAADAVVTLYRVEGDGSLEPVATAVTDEDGAFHFAPSEEATFKVQADHDGLSSPLSPGIDLRGGRSVVDLVLMVPSPLLMLAASCDEDFGAVVVGSVYDNESEVVLPGARVSARWEVGGREERRVVEANARGHYRICGVEPSGSVQFQAEMLGRQSPWERVELERPALVFHDVYLRLGDRTALEEEVLSEFILTEIVGSMGDLRGELVDRDTGEPIRQAVVRIRGTSLQGVTDNEGRFVFPDIQPGTYILEIQHLGYSVRTSEVEVPVGQDVLVRMQLSPQAIQLDEVVVTARPTLPGRTEMSPFRREVAAGVEMARAEERGAMAHDVLRTAFPGLRVVERYTELGPEICIETNRRIQSLQNSIDPMDRDPRTCPSMVLLVIDGVRTSSADAAHLILGMSASEIESIEFLEPTQAATLYGIGQFASNGVVVIWTRGRGPHVAPGRNRR